VPEPAREDRACRAAEDARHQRPEEVDALGERDGTEGHGDGA